MSKTKRRIQRRYASMFSCCGERMLEKEGYRTETDRLFVCQRCGKSKWIRYAPKEEEE